MLDSFGRDITYMRVSVTELCNLRCRYCMPADGVCKKQHEDMLTEDETITAIKEVHPYEEPVINVIELYRTGL